MIFFLILLIFARVESQSESEVTTTGSGENTGSGNSFSDSSCRDFIINREDIENRFVDRADISDFIRSQMLLLKTSSESPRPTTTTDQLVTQEQNKEDILQTPKPAAFVSSCDEACEISHQDIVVIMKTKMGKNVTVYGSCDSPPAIVLQRRINDSTNFNRTYNEYVRGFGDINGSFWLGLENMHMLAPYAITNLEMKIVLDGNTTFTHTFKYFHVDDEDHGYALSAKDIYKKFRVESEEFPCSEGRSGWWFNAKQLCSLNGHYGKDGFKWHQNGGSSKYQIYQKTEMRLYNYK